jgi:hypothetical protein
LKGGEKLEDLKYVSLATTYEKDISFDSERFIKMRLKICHDGINPNKSAFSVEDIQKAESSIPNTPILANTKVDEENQTVDLGSHDMHWEKHNLALPKVEGSSFKIIAATNDGQDKAFIDKEARSVCVPERSIAILVAEYQEKKKARIIKKRY